MTLLLNEMVLVRRARRGLVVRCVSGLAWVTTRGDTTDRVLIPGETLHLRPTERVIVNSLEDGTTVTLADPAGRPVRTRSVVRTPSPESHGRPVTGLWSGLNGWARVVGDRL